jgi:alcohol dehydrogenase (cytochrome c)
MWVTGSYDVATNHVLWGTGNPAPMFNPFYRPGDNLYTNSLISWDPDTGKMNWYHQYVPGDMWDYDAAGSHILIDGQIAGQPHKLVTHSARNGFLYAFERTNGPDITGQALHGGDQLDEGNRSEDRLADRLRPDKGHPGLFGPAKPDHDGPHQEALPIA